MIALKPDPHLFRSLRSSLRLHKREQVAGAVDGLRVTHILDHRVPLRREAVVHDSVADCRFTNPKRTAQAVAAKG